MLEHKDWVEELIEQLYGGIAPANVEFRIEDQSLKLTSVRREFSSEGDRIVIELTLADD